jgi:hypothetical protein
LSPGGNRLCHQAPATNRSPSATAKIATSAAFARSQRISVIRGGFPAK